ncbi:MAG TPA: UbiA family prenyltransferase [Longimicrobium sp.]
MRVTARAGVLHLVRADDWWLYHLLPLLAAAYASIAFYAVGPAVAYPAVARLILSIVCIAAYAHLINDIGDAEQDAVAGKPDRWRGVSLVWRGAIAAAFLACGFGAWVGAGLSARMLELLTVIAALQPVYALHPLRLKERGGWGLAADALHTHALPTLFCVALFAQAAGAPVWAPLPLVLTAWAFFVGVRGIVYHQRTDEANDRRAGVATFVTRHGSGSSAAFVRRAVFPAELVALGAAGVALFPVIPVPVLAFVAYFALMQLLRAMGMWRVTFADPAPAERTAYIPLLAFYRSLPAPAFALVLALRDARFVPLLAVHLLVFAGPILRQVGDVFRIARPLWWGVRRRLLRAPGG